ncbi:polyphosphate kinase 2 [Candidatus Phycosocius spiralis]|uniref:ADP/GDP-polyphosphate phosphotransferase n=1 Tax=Candidatus Phycosocius spiralis TaxID=2815099 RepID=A0ABQ4PWU9_9PROT|nr:polyphosphate kinase 2 [Candidatus Phycosocius spiralis]GIU67493.1 polyphosphate kinase [Candidatus Phycosocius spiralis]
MTRGKSHIDKSDHSVRSKLSDTEFSEQLIQLQVALVTTQQWLMETGAKVLIILEGRDAAGKDGTIKRLTEHMSTRSTRVVALPKPSDREKSQWYFQRYTAYLPAAGEVVIFNRSWYNRGGVEPVMGFCQAQEHADFLRDVIPFELLLSASGIHIIKIWLDITREEQARRLEARRTDPLARLKISPLDGLAQEKWDDYTEARNQMLIATHTHLMPWYCVRADSKKQARLAIIRHILHQLACPALVGQVDAPAPNLMFKFHEKAIKDGRLAD